MSNLTHLNNGKPFTSDMPPHLAPVDDQQRAYSALMSIDAGLPRDKWVRAGMAAKSAGLSESDFINWSRQAANFKNEADCKSAWASFKSGGAVGAGTLFRMAKDAGWSDDSPGSHQYTSRPPISAPAPVKQAANANAVDVWDRCIPATLAEPYIDRKKGKPDGLRVYPASAPPLVIRGQNVAGYLAVPCWKGNDLQTLQFIPPDGGDKLNLPGAPFNDGFFTVGQITDRAYIVEGIGQAWAVNQATGAAAVVCFGASRMTTVAKTLRTQYPAARLVIVPDRGKEEQAGKIAATASGEWVAMPADKPGNYDANDYAQEYGTEALLTLLDASVIVESGVWPFCSMMRQAASFW